MKNTNDKKMIWLTDGEFSEEYFKYLELKKMKQMGNKNYFSVAYKVLSYLKYCYETGKNIDIDILQAGIFYVSNKQFNNTLQKLNDDGYLKGLEFIPSESGLLVTGLNNIKITSSGLQYLEENSMMKKAHKVFKDVWNWLPMV